MKRLPIALLLAALLVLMVSSMVHAGSTAMLGDEPTDEAFPSISQHQMDCWAKYEAYWRDRLAEAEQNIAPAETARLAEAYPSISQHQMDCWAKYEAYWRDRLDQ
ncbi:MAG: hypothetical protein U9R25_04550 [Chloroflexota bacterium]|nr:hypothetical protein [Chloroflexota bacterium]